MELIDAAFPLLKGTNEWVAVAAGVLGPGLGAAPPPPPRPRMRRRLARPPWQASQTQGGWRSGAQTRRAAAPFARCTWSAR